MSEQLRDAVVGGLPTLAELTPGRTGNLSVRSGDRIAITPSGVPYDRIEQEDVPVLSIDGEQMEGSLDPSSEVPMHLGLYRSMELGAIVHVHAPWTTTLAVLQEPLPPVHYMIALAGGHVPVAEYAPYGTVELAENAVDAMQTASSTACILANHGLIAGGTDVPEALETAVAVESTAQVYLQARAVGEPVSLDSDEIDAVATRFESYGQDDVDS